MTPSFEHKPVMLSEVLQVLGEVPTGLYVDATLGGAGHASALLQNRSDMSLVGIDRDPHARAAASIRLAPFGSRAMVVAGRFDELGEIMAKSNDQDRFNVTGVLFDLGVSSAQLDDPERGFSYRRASPLDMRMNRDDALSAATVVNEWPHTALTRLLRELGDERFASRIAARIIDHRPLLTTTELSDVVVEAIPAATRRTGGHPAKRTFQAIRIAVNGELEQIPIALSKTIDALSPGGRAVIISYHSGEHRLVKQSIVEAETGGCVCRSVLGCGCGALRLIRQLSPKVRKPSPQECEDNPRATSAQMRCFRKLVGAGGSKASVESASQTTTCREMRR